MFNPAMFGVSPQQMQQVREIGRHLKVEIRKCAREGYIEIRYIPIDPEDAQALTLAANLTNSWAEYMAMMHDSFLGMKGQIIQVD